MLSLRNAMRSLVAGTMLVAANAALLLLSSPASATTLPSGFQEQTVYSGLTEPTNIEFSLDGRVFVAQKNGVIKVFDGLADPTPDTFADLSVNVHNQWDRGLLGLALAPNFPTNPWVYVLYTYDAPPGRTAPVWNDVCANPNGGTCLVTARLSRLQASGNQMTGSEQVLISDWCQQYPSHSIGDLKFGIDGALYVSGGDGANFDVVDYGQLGTPINPCGDPPGGAMTPPSAEGGALRSQDVRTLADPTGLDGSILRLDPSTGAALPDNPLARSSDANARRIVAHGLRNPFRFTMRPGTNEVWIGDVGWTNWEEIDRLTSPTSGVTNFGWPCYEGGLRHPGYDGPDLTLCESLYSGAGQTGPYHTYKHSARVVPGETCPTGLSSITGLAFYPSSGGAYPATYNGALFFADYSRNCLWAMLPGTDGLPNPTNIITFGAAAAAPVDLAIGPGGELYYADLGGTVRRIRYFPNNQPPVAVLGATPTSGGTPLTVSFDGRNSTDADPADKGRLRYAWDFTNNGSVDATTPTASFTYQTAGTYTARLTVTDTLGATNTKTVTISAGNDAPTAVVDSPTGSFTWAVGDTINFSGHATDPQQGTLPASALTWHTILHHCATPTNCHNHPMNTYTGIASGTFTAPDHEYPSFVEVQVTARDSDGLLSIASVSVNPKPVNLTFNSNLAGLQLTIGSTSQATPFTMTVIQKSTNSLIAPTPQALSETSYTFGSWSDGGAQTHVITAPTTADTYTATYKADALGSPTRWSASAFYGTKATLSQDINGDGRADLIAVNNIDTRTMLSTGSSLGSPTRWSTSAFYGTKATLSQDINGDSRADLIAVNDTDTWTMLSTGSSFGSPTRWSASAFYGTKATLSQDINGDGRADLIAVNNSDTWTMLSTGSSFGSPTRWSASAFYGTKATLTSDVNGDGRADLIAVNNTDTWIMLSTGSSFGSSTRWSASAFYGTKATLAGDVNGDRRGDLIAVNDSETWIMLSTGSAFDSPTRWSASAFYGTKATLAGDVNGDRRGDLIAVNDGDTWIMLSTVG